MCSVVLVLCVIAVGCGSADQSPPSETAHRSGATAEADATGDTADKAAAQHGANGSRGNRDADGARDATRGGVRDEVPRKGVDVASGQVGKHCPGNLAAATCEALARGAGKPPSGTHEALVTDSCAEVLTKAECEAVRAMRKQAADAPDSVLMSGAEFKECLENPTPRCEELLGPLLERKRESEEVGAGG